MNCIAIIKLCFERRKRKERKRKMVTMMTDGRKKKISLDAKIVT